MLGCHPGAGRAAVLSPECRSPRCSRDRRPRLGRPGPARSASALRYRRPTEAAGDPGRAPVWVTGPHPAWALAGLRPQTGVEGCRDGPQTLGTPRKPRSEEITLSSVRGPGGLTSLKPSLVGCAGCLCAELLVTCLVPSLQTPLSGEGGAGLHPRLPVGFSGEALGLATRTLTPPGRPPDTVTLGNRSPRGARPTASCLPGCVGHRRPPSSGLPRQRR